MIHKRVGARSRWQHSDILQTLYLVLNNPRAQLNVGRHLTDLTSPRIYNHEALVSLQDIKLKMLLDHARSNVPYYDKYVPWQDVNGVQLRERLSEYPILTKNAIREDPTALQQSHKINHFYIRNKTGGTTGAPIEVWHDRHHMAITDAAYWRGLSWIGIKPWTKGISAHGFGRGSWYGRLRMRLTNKLLVDGFGKNANDRDRIVNKIRRFSPTYITGYVSDLISIGKECHAGGVKIGTILTTGEMLYDHQRKEIERLYKGKVFNYYGCNEVGSMAFECEKGTKHVTDEHVILEVVNELGKPVWDEPGRILLTDLDNYLTPLIRYEVGDIGILTNEQCACGRNLTVLKGLEGRTQDALCNEDGDRLSTLFFAGRFRELRAINRIQLIQRDWATIELIYEGTNEKIDKELDEIIGEIKNRLGPQMQIIPKQVTKLFYTERGKFQLIIPLAQ